MRLLSPPLQAFLAIAQHKTVHAAAQYLHLTQTAVTQRLKTLEKRLSTSLFVRSRRGMLLTKEGESLLRYCHAFQALEGEALAFITQTGIEKTVRICITGPTTIMRSRIIPHCAKVMAKFPQLSMEFDINDNETGVQALRRGETQLAIIEQHWLSQEMEYKALPPEEYILVTPYHWKKRKLKEIIANEKIIDFDANDQMTFSYLKKYELYDLANKDRHFTNRTETLAQMITHGIGYGVLPIEFAKPYLANKKLYAFNSKQTFPHSLVLAWFPRHQLPKYFVALIQACTNNSLRL